MDTHYLHNWIKENGVTDENSARQLLKVRSVVDDLRQSAKDALPLLTDEPISPYSIVAGVGLDPAGRFACTNPKCIAANADKLFRHVWHYFDTIVINEASAALLVSGDGHLTRAEKDIVVDQVNVALAVEHIGATSLVDYRIKGGVCEQHIDEHAREQGLSTIVDRRDEFVKQILEEGDFIIERKNHLPSNVIFSHPGLNGTITYEFKKEWRLRSTSDIYELVADEFFCTNIAHLTTDLRDARRLGIALGTGERLQSDMLTQATQFGTPEIAFKLELPVIDSIPTEVLIRLREEERESFLRFRKRLREGIEQTIKALDSPSAQKIACEIQVDLIDAELADLRQRLKVAERSLLVKSAVGVGLGALVTTCGMLASSLAPALVPAAITAGAATTCAITGTAIAKRQEEVGEAALNDMFFLWKAMHAH